MRVDPEVKKAAGTLLGHVIRGESPELTAAIQATDSDTYLGCLGMCLLVSGYIAIDMSGKPWPVESDLRETARQAAASPDTFELSESVVYDYLARSVLGGEPLPDVLGSAEAAVTIPFLVTAAMLTACCPSGQEWREYLEFLCDATNKAGATEMAVLPALALRTAPWAAQQDGTH